LKLLFNNKAHVIEHGGMFFSTVKTKFLMPSVIQIEYYVRKPYKKPRFSKKAVFTRDNYQCQYCGCILPRPTLDHIIPRCKGGENTWTNVVTACHACNNKKGDRPIREAGLKLASMPYEPKYIISSEMGSKRKCENWEKYFLAHLPHAQQASG
jgi:hypothetical protein